MARIYTKTGDDGTTGLIGGRRVPKDSPHIEAGGSLDELNAWIGVVRSHKLPDTAERLLLDVQEDLVQIGAELATPEGTERAHNQRLGDEKILNLEKAIDGIEDSLEPLKRFILPGGSVPGACLHLARAVARRAERQCVALSRTEPVNPKILHYLNRLSDLLFMLARYINQLQSMPETRAAAGKSR